MSPSKVSTISFDKFYNIVDGKQRSSDSNQNGVNPVNGEKLWDVPVATEKDLDDAVASGEKAFESWSQTPIEKRKELLQKYCDVYMSYADEMIELVMQETGKPVSYTCSTYTTTS